MSLKRMLTVTGIVCAVLLVALFSFRPGFAAALPSEPNPPGEEVGDELPKSNSYFCMNDGIEHPVGSRLADVFEDVFEVDYDLVMRWFCEDEMGFGQIMLALTTAKVYGGNPADFLDRRAEGDGWGQIWQAEGLIGRGRPKADDQSDDVEPAEDDGPPENRGRPESTGRPEDVGPDGNRGRHLGWGQSKDKGRP